MTAPVETSGDRNLERAIAWVRAIESGATGDALVDFVTPDIVHEDMPNRVFPKGSKSDLRAMREASERGQKIMRRQRYDIVSAVGSGNTVAMELDWWAELAVPVAGLEPGDEMRARVAIFIEFRDGRICYQRDYCCYEPLSPRKALEENDFRPREALNDARNALNGSQTAASQAIGGLAPEDTSHGRIGS
jgi:ketosteroid isomerase-like protein